MSDEFAGQRLPDLPTCGYSTRKQREGTDAIQIFMRAVERERLVLLLIVCGGMVQWKQRAKQWGSLIPDDKIEEMFRYFVQQAGPRPLDQLHILTTMRGKEVDFAFGRG